MPLPRLTIPTPTERLGIQFNDGYQSKLQFFASPDQRWAMFDGRTPYNYELGLIDPKGEMQTIQHDLTALMSYPFVQQILGLVVHASEILAVRKQLNTKREPLIAFIASHDKQLVQKDQEIADKQTLLDGLHDQLQANVDNAQAAVDAAAALPDEDENKAAQQEEAANAHAQATAALDNEQATRAVHQGELDTLNTERQAIIDARAAVEQELAPLNVQYAVIDQQLMTPIIPTP